MTGQLKTTMERHADTLDAPVLDLDAIMASGRRRAHRRTAVIGGLAAAAVVAGGAVFLGVGDHGHDTIADQYAGLGDTSFTYAVGSVLHSGDTTVDLGADIASYVQTSSGVVFTDPQHRVYVVDDAAPRQIGTSTASSTLVSDDAGTTVAWVDGDRLEIYQVGSQAPVSVPVQRPASGESPVVHAISGGLVWFWDARGTMTYQVDLQQLRLWSQDNSQGVQDVSDGLVLSEVGDTGLAVHELPADGAVDGSFRQVGPETRNIYSGDLAPDAAHWFTQDADQFAVFDSQTGQRTDPPHPGFEFAAPYRWLDDDTIAVLALRTVTKHAEDDPISLLTCHVSTNACSVTAADIGTMSQIAVPVGQAIGG